MKKVILLGYMGVGKTILGKLVAKELGIPFFDLDFLIEKAENLSIKEIFDSKGEIYFRKKEHEVFKNFLNQQTNFVLSLGGGTPCYANNHLLLSQEGVISFYLRAKVQTIANRLKSAPNKRPLIANVKNMEEFVGQHILERSFYYNHAMYSIDVENRTPQDVVKEIELLVKYQYLNHL